MVKKYAVSFFVAIIFSVVVISAQSSAQTFKDVTPDKDYYDAVEFLADAGVFSKAPKFNPSSPVKRGQLAKIMALSLNLDTKNVKNPNFKDVPKTHQFYPYIAALTQAGIINGYPDGTFGPNKQVTREHMSKFLVNGFKFKPAHELYFNFSDDVNSSPAFDFAYTLHFYGVTNAESFNLKKSVTRAQIALFINRALDAYVTESYTHSIKELPISDNLEALVWAFSNDEVMDMKVNALTQELYFRPIGSGETGFMASSATDYEAVEDIYIEFYVDELLQLKHKIVPKLEGEFKIPYPHQIYSAESFLKHFKYEFLIVDKDNKGIIERESDEPNGFEAGYVWTFDDGELIRIDAEYMNGKKERSYVLAIENGSEIYSLYAYEDPKAFEIKLDGEVDDISLTKGDSTGLVLTKDEAYDEDMDETYSFVKATFTKPGTYILKEDNSNIIVKVIEYNGNKYGAYTYIR